MEVVSNIDRSTDTYSRTIDTCHIFIKVASQIELTRASTSDSRSLTSTQDLLLWLIPYQNGELRPAPSLFNIV